MRYAFALDLVDDAQRIADYEKAHEKIWPAVRDHLLANGIVAMEIYRLGTRLFMVMDTDDAIYSPEAMARADAANPAIAEWEALMWTYQVPTPWTPAGTKWMPLQKIFSLAEQG